jgi:FkbM family methyltransferase
MIHQCYFDPSQRARLFTSPLYRGFGLYASVNPDIDRNCPELEDPNRQVLLSEYGAMLHLWRNPECDPDPWIGFTSYRQLDKFPTIIRDRQAIESALAEYDVLGWAAYEFVDAVSGRPLTMAEQGEWGHPGITMCLWHLLMTRNEPLPPHYLTGTSGGVYCNYWLMSRANFHTYMSWSYPLVVRCLEQPDEFIRCHRRSLAYLIERLFICWCDLSAKRVLHIAPPRKMPCVNHYLHPREDKPSGGSQERFVKLSCWNASLFELCHRHRALPRGIIHVGAHYAEEREVYRGLGAAHVLWIEADPHNMPQLSANIAPYAGSSALQACLADTEGQPTTFYRTDNQGESSSILPLGTHRERFPNIQVQEAITLSTRTFASLVEHEGIALDLYDFLVMDVQGAELRALQGFGDYLHRLNGIYVEVSLESLYRGCALLPDLDAYLGARGFTRRETLITQRNHGDAFYLRTGVYPDPPADLVQRRDHAVRHLCMRRAYVCQSSGQELASLELLASGQIGTGKTPDEQVWKVRSVGHDILLEIIGRHGRAACLRYLNDFLWVGGSLVRDRQALALLPAALLTQHRRPLGYPHQTNLPIELVDRLRARFGLEHFVETGTRHGVTTRAMAPHFKHVATIELDPVSFQTTAAQLAANSHIHCFQGDSVQQLPQILNALGAAGVVWLDAHWSGGDTGKGDVECPVLGELAAIYAHRPDHIVFIDDARLFLSPPPPPHDARQWPSFAAISEFFARQCPVPYVAIVGDVIVAGPWAIGPVVETFCQERGC